MFYRITVCATLLIQALEIYPASSDVDETLIDVGFCLYRLCFISILRSSISTIPIEGGPIVDSCINVPALRGFSAFFVCYHIKVLFRLSLIRCLYYTDVDRLFLIIMIPAHLICELLYPISATQIVPYHI